MDIKVVEFAAKLTEKAMGTDAYTVTLISISIKMILSSWGNKFHIAPHSTGNWLLRIAVTIDIKALRTLYLGSEWAATKCQSMAAP